MEFLDEQLYTPETLKDEEELAALALTGIAATKVPELLEQRIEAVLATEPTYTVNAVTLESLDDTTQDTMPQGGGPGPSVETDDSETTCILCKSKEECSHIEQEI